ncbi:MAG: hypothetical protein JXB39_00680 [Deltaproteobacteria bacterium]|nr:hypothetical protein [Deltaproteobacteria bacterium]
MQRLPLLAFVCLAACGYSYERFEQDKTEAMCYKMEECEWLEGLGWTLQECLNQTGSDQADACVDYDSAAARDCVDAIEAATCEDYAADVGLDACYDVCRDVDTGS